MFSYRRCLSAALVLSPLSIATSASAQDATTNVVKKEATDIKVQDLTTPNGVYASLRGDLAFSFSDTQKVVGQLDGTTINLGAKVDAHADVIQDAHEWRNGVLLNAGVTKNPAIAEFIKNVDSLQVESIYLYHVKPWIGPFARFRLDTAMFAGTDVRAAPTNYKITKADGTTSQTCDPNSGVPCATAKLPLSDGFQPLSLKESIGAFAQPYKSVPFNAELRLGVGAQEIFADHQFAVTDAADTADNCPAAGNPTQKSAVQCIEVTELTNVFQLGLEANVEVWGALYDSKINYRLYGGLLAPFAHGALPKAYTDSGGKDDVGQLTNIDLGANVNVKIVEWASLGYEFKAVRVPALLPDTFQVRNTVFLTVGFGVDNKPPPPPAPPTPAAPAPAPAAK
jgi:hypothetical protein